MAGMKNFEDLDIWKDSIQLAKEIYLLTQKDVFEKNQVLRDQIRQNTFSISNQIVQGYEMNSNQQFLKHLKLAKITCSESRSMISLLYEIGLIEIEEKEKISSLTTLLSNKIVGLIKFLDKPKT